MTRGIRFVHLPRSRRGARSGTGIAKRHPCGAITGCAISPPLTSFISMSGWACRITPWSPRDWARVREHDPVRGNARSHALEPRRRRSIGIAPGRSSGRFHGAQERPTGRRGSQPQPASSSVDDGTTDGFFHRQELRRPKPSSTPRAAAGAEMVSDSANWSSSAV